MNKRLNKAGFTLIELLVVVAIIGLLSTLAVVALGAARVKARDAKRLSDLKQLQTALELHYADNNAYPAGAGIDLGATNYYCLNSAGFAAMSCANPYMGRVPIDPSAGYYKYTVGTGTYTVDATLEGTVNGLSGAIKLTPAGIGK